MKHYIKRLSCYFVATFLCATACTAAAHANYLVTARSVDDKKAVFATIRSTDKVSARARLSGTLVSLSVDEGSFVENGDIIGIIDDSKLKLKISSLEAKIAAAKSQVSDAERALERGEQLKERGIIATAALDKLKTAHSVALNNLKSARAERKVIERQKDEGTVFAPASGRVLEVPVTRGSVVMAGESLAVIAANRYILRLELPERHARFITKGSKIVVANRGVSQNRKAVGEGEIVKVFPEIQKGRVIADAIVPDLGDYFVGERITVWVPAGERRIFAVPYDYVFKRYGMDYVKLASGTEVVVQLGLATTINALNDAVEVLSGLREGDELVKP
jgi:RND family efflux transporter MFP subunit